MRANRERRLAAFGCFDRRGAYRHGLRDRQDARFARRLLARRAGVRKHFPARFRFRSEELLGGAARIPDPLAIVIARVRPWRWGKHDLFRTGGLASDIGTGFAKFGKLNFQWPATQPHSATARRPRPLDAGRVQGFEPVGGGAWLYRSCLGGRTFAGLGPRWRRVPPDQ